MITMRCTLCGGDFAPYNGTDPPTQKAIRVGIYHTIRGADAICVCNSCTRTIVARWAKLYGLKVQAIKDSAELASLVGPEVDGA